MKAKFRELVNQQRFNKVMVGIAIGLFAVMGTYLLFFSKAAGIHTVPSSIVADCSSDVTAALNNWIRSVPDGSVLSFGTNACYRIEGTLLMEDRNNLTLNGNGSTFKATTIGTGDVNTVKNRAAWRFLAGSNITINNMVVRGVYDRTGYNATYEAQHGFYFGSTQGAVLDSVQIYDVWGDAVTVGYDWRYGTVIGVPSTRNVMIKNSRIDGTGRMALAVTHGEGVTLQDNYITNVDYHIVDLEPDIGVEPGSGSDADLVKDIHVLRNTIGRVKLHVVSTYGPNTYSNVGNVTIAGNTMERHGDSCAAPVNIEGTRHKGLADDSTESALDLAPQDRFPTGFVIENNRFKTLSRGVWMKKANSLMLRNNTIQFFEGGCAAAGTSPNGQAWWAVEATDAHGITVTDNDLSGGNAPIRLVDSLTTGVRSCNNQMVAGGGFNQPSVCEPYTPDTTKPSAGITEPASGATVNNTINLKATAVDNVAVVKVEFLVDGLVKERRFAAPYDFSWDTKTAGNGSRILRVVAYDAVGNSTRSAAVNVIVANNLLPLRINSGGPAYTAAGGTMWKTDQYYVLGLDGVNRTSSTTNAIAGTTDPAIYQTDRWCSRGYDLPIGNGTYTLRLHFAEYFYTTNGSRVFNVLGEGQTLLSNFDIHQEVGANRALIKEFPVTVTDGALNITFTNITDCSKISGLEVLSNSQASTVNLTSPPNNATFIAPASVTLSADVTGSITGVEFFQGTVKLGEDTTSPYSFTWGNVPAGTYSLTARATDSTNTTITSGAINITVSGGTGASIVRLNAGGPAYTDPSGNIWAADQYYSDGGTASTVSPIANTDKQPLYQTNRWGMQNYAIPITNGDYTLRLHFAETFYTTNGTGARVFNVLAEGTTKLNNFDIFARFGASTAGTEEFPVTVADGVLNLDFQKITDYPKISGIEIIDASAPPPTSRPEDINEDGAVNALDFLIFKSKFGQCGATIGRSDINADGCVNALDFLKLKAQYGT